MADLNKIVEDLSSLSVIEAAELSKLLEEKWGVSAAAPVAAAAPAAGQEGSVDTGAVAAALAGLDLAGAPTLVAVPPARPVPTA